MTSMCIESPGDCIQMQILVLEALPRGPASAFLTSSQAMLLSDVTAADRHIDHISGGTGSTIKNNLADLIAMSRNKYWPQLGLVPAVQ